MTHGIGTHGHIALGDTIAGTITVGMTHGTIVVIGDTTTLGIMTLGIMADIGAITTITHITADGMEDGTRIITTITDISMALTSATTLEAPYRSI